MLSRSHRRPFAARTGVDRRRIDRMRSAHLRYTLAALLITATAGAQFGGIYGGRTRGQAGLGRKGGRPTAEAIEKGLAWLAHNQNPDGSFGGKTDSVAVTSLTILAFFACGNTRQRGRYAANVELAIHWLRRRLRKDGWFVQPRARRNLRTHALATLVFVEAVGMGDRKLLPAARKSVDALLEAQNADGGWSLVERGNSHPLLLGIVVPAIWLAQKAGIRADESKWSKSKKAVLRALEHADTDQSPGALFAAPFHELTPRSGVVRKCADRLLRTPPARDAVESRHLAWSAMFQVGGAYWKQWRKPHGRQLLTSQVQDGDDRAYWNAQGTDRTRTRREETTALSVLSLQVYYRYSRLVR